MPRLPAVLWPATTAATVFSLIDFGAPAIVAAAATAAAVTCTQRWLRPTPCHVAAVLRKKDEQLADTAHELRTPLTAVMTALEMLREDYVQTAQDRGAFLDQATVAARHMAFVLNDVLDLAAIESGRISLQLRQHAAADLGADLQQVMNLTAKARGVELAVVTAAPELRVFADRNRVLQVLFNLVGNALKFAQRQVAVAIEPAANGVRFAVTDDGPGVPADRRDCLFTRYGRAHDDARVAVPGTGLGLHLCRLLVERMSGTIGFLPGTVRGSTFWFELPAVAPRLCNTIPNAATGASRR